LNALRGRAGFLRQRAARQSRYAHACGSSAFEEIAPGYGLHFANLWLSPSALAIFCHVFLPWDLAIGATAPFTARNDSTAILIAS
jgi:hypothetical protein